MVKGRNMGKQFRELLYLMTLCVVGMCTGLQAQEVPIEISVTHTADKLGEMVWKGMWVPQSSFIELTLTIRGKKFVDRADIIDTREVAGRTLYLCDNDEAFQFIDGKPIPVLESREAIRKPELTTAIRMLESKDATLRTKAAWTIWKKMQGQELLALGETRKTENPQTNVQPFSHNLTVHQIQATLKKLGYDPGASDGALGSKTISALKQFQTDNGLAGTGKLDKDTINKLREKQ